MATELPRDTLDLLPQGVPSDLGATGRQLLQMPKQKKAMPGEPPKWPEVEQEVQTWIVERCQTEISVSTKMIQEKGKRIAWGKNIDDFSGTPKWCFNFMKKEGLSMRTRTKLAPKLPAAYENQVLEFHSYVISLQKTTLSCPKLLVCMRSLSHLMCHPTELWTSKEQRPWLLKLVMRKHISLLF